MTQSYRRRSIAWLIGVTAIGLTGGARAQKPASSGVFVDRDGSKHSWTVTDSHVLLWGGAPYVPVGGLYNPRTWVSASTEDGWTADTRDLDAIKASGLKDILLDPVRPLLGVPPAAIQRVLDYAEKAGLRYGIGFGGGIVSGLSGLVVKPASYRIPGIRGDMDVAWDVADADSARFVLVDGRDGTQVFKEGVARVRDGQVSVAADARVMDGSVALLYPHKQLAPGQQGGLPDVWSDYDTYRDRLLMHLAPVKFGPGLRFFLDPLGARIRVEGESDYLIPDTSAFCLEFEGYLCRKYQSIEDLLNAWSVIDREIKDHRQAAQMAPLWADNRGLSFLLDPSTGKRYQVNAAESRYWKDLRDFRSESLSYYTSAAADLLKRQVADVPVLYTHSQPHRMFVNSARQGGPDGLGISAFGRGSALITGGADSAYSQSGDWVRTAWLVATGTMDTESPTKQQIGYASKQALFYDLDWLRSMGTRGFFVRGLRVAPYEKLPGYQLMEAPEQLGWLSEYASRVNLAGQAGGQGPRVLPFPAAAAGMCQSGPIGNGSVWWVPSLASGRRLDLGSGYAGYTITMQDAEVAVMWSLKGPRDTRISVADPRKVEVRMPDNTPVPLRPDVKGRFVRLVLDETPRIIRSGGQDVFPIEAVEDVLKDLRALVAEATAKKLPVHSYKYSLDAAEGHYKHRDMPLAYMRASVALAEIMDLTQPYSWREAEFSETQTFSEVVPDSAASGGGYLALQTGSAPPREGYTVQLKFAAPGEDTYAVWLAVSPSGPLSSPFAWVIDTGPSRSSADAVQVGSGYMGDRFVWLKLGSLKLNAGAHAFTLRVTDRAAGLNRYLLNVDALLVTRSGFVPHGISKPSVAAAH